MSDYRNRIYSKYASEFQDSGPHFDSDAAAKWGRAYDYYFRGWLPTSKDADIAELACGGGRLLHFFKQRGYTNLVGVDISPQQVQLARQVISNVKEENVLKFLKGNPVLFDLIVALDLVEHFRKDEVMCFLDVCYNALKPGGRLILQTPNSESPWGMAVRYGDFTHETAFDNNSLKRLLGIVGFSEIMARETGPVVHGPFSFGRYLIWRFIHVVLAIWNLAETGTKGSSIYTRVFIISGKKIE